MLPARAATRIGDQRQIPVTTRAGCLLGGMKSRSFKVQSVTSNIDKILKMLNWGPAFIAQVLETDNASTQVVSGFRLISEEGRFWRNGIGSFNAAQSFPRLIERGQEFYARCQGMEWKLDPKNGTSYKVKVSLPAKEHALAIISSGSKLFEWTFFNICFLLCVPCMSLERWFRLGPTAKSIGQQFGLFFLIKDIFLYSGVLSELARKKCELNRLLPLSDPKTSVQLRNKFRYEAYQAFIVTIKSVCDIVLGILGVCKVKTNPWVSVSLGLASSLVGMWEIWRDTPPGELTKEEMPDWLKLPD